MSTNDINTNSASNSLTWQGCFKAETFTALAWAAFQIAILLWPTIDILIRRSGHVGFAIALALVLSVRGDKLNWKKWLSYIMALTALVPAFYLATQLDRIDDRIAEIDPVIWTDWLFGCLLFGLLLEASRRVVGAGLCILVLLFVAYQLLGSYIPGILGHRMEGVTLFMDIIFLSERGVFGIPTGISAEVVFYFVLFAAIFDVYGGGRLIIELAIALTGRSVGGPAKAAVVASGIMGSVSGSAVANVMSTGIFTIPLMKRVGYEPRFAASVEAVASTGGQIMPPVMGAGAFIMANFLQTPYRNIVIAATLPAVLFFIGLLVVVHLRARLQALPTLKEGEIAPIGPILRSSWHMLIPLVWLATMIVWGFAVTDATLQASLLTIVIGTLRKSSRKKPIAIIESLAQAANRSISVALPCALASIIVMVISFTGLGTKFSGIIVDFSQEILWLALLCGGIGSLIMGAGMPTTSAYIMSAVLIAPALIRLDVLPIVAHLFVFYMAILSMLTPPVALAAYAAATVAETDPGSTGWSAFRLAIPGIIIPFAFVLHPDLILWDSFWGTLQALIITLVSVVFAAIAIVGWFGRPLGWMPRVVAGVLVGAVFLPNSLAAGFAVLALLMLVAYAWKK